MEQEHTGQEEKKEYRGNPLVTLIIIIVLMILSIVFIWGSYNSLSEPTEDDIQELASCLDNKGAIMYGTNTSLETDEQINMLGDAFSEINYVDCDKNKVECEFEDIIQYPTWRIGDEFYVGPIELERLSKLSGCDL